MKNGFEQFTNLYSLSKTLRFELRPVGKTAEHIEKSGIIQQDERRAESYKAVKKIIDRYHQDFIEKSLNGFNLKLKSSGKQDSLEEYFSLYMERTRNDKQKKTFETIQGNLRKQIANQLKSDEVYKRIGKKELIKEDLPAFVTSEIDKSLVNEFKDFTTYFAGFHENRKNMYSDEEKSTAIAYRLVHENLPKFIDNMGTFERGVAKLDPKKIEKLYSEIKEYMQVKNIASMFKLDYYSKALTQKQIEVYNLVIGGKTENEGKKKIQGLNEAINLYNQQQKDKNACLPKLKQLYKQILSDREYISWLPQSFESDNELLEKLQQCYTMLKESVFDKLKEVLLSLSGYDLSRIYLRNDSQLTDISKKMFGSWSIIEMAIKEDYKVNNPQTSKEKGEKFAERIDKYIKSFDSFSIGFINKCLASLGEPYNKQIEIYFAQLGETTGNNEKTDDWFTQIQTTYEAVKDLLNTEYPKNKNLAQDKENVEKIKTFLDAIKGLQRFVKPLLGRGDEAEKDEKFYGELSVLWEALDKITPLYNMVRNYVTRKPYSVEKIKLNFEKVQLVYNWPKLEQGFILRNRESDTFYLGIPKTNDVIKEIKYLPRDNNDIVELMNYDQGKAGQLVQNLMYKDGGVVKVNGNRIEIREKGEKGEFTIKEDGNDKVMTGDILDSNSSKSIVVSINDKKYSFDIDKDGMINYQLEFDKEKYLPPEINRIRKLKSYNSGNSFVKKDCMAFIDFYKKAVSEYKKSNFIFKETSEYNSFKDFTDDIDNQAYSLTFEQISFSNINQLVSEGKLYLFQIYNKDFSPYSKGTPNMHTLYWKMLFDENNLKDVVYKLNGQAEVFYRKKSIQNVKPTHPANQPIANKNEQNKKKESTFKYDLIKDRRYTVDKFQFHVPITLNFKSSGTDNINNRVNDYLKVAKDVHVIGIDRGERHLLYLTVIDGKGNIKEQFSLNEIINEYNGNTYRTNYRDLLDKREKERDEARKSWHTIQNIKELKEGYLSQVVHKIAGLMVKYNAIVVLEDLNFGFMRSRQKVEKSVYQKFEKMLIDKLNYLADKKKEPNEIGGLFHAYQLTSKFESFKKLGKQSGFLFYIPAWNTSNMDPVTGFVNLFDTRYESVEKAKTFFGKFDTMRYNDQKDWFEFEFDYNNFTTKAEGSRTKWILCTNGTRIETKRDPQQNNQFVSTEIDLVKQFKQLFNSYEIDIKGNLKEAVVAQSEKAFFEKLLYLLRLTLQMRNSITNTETDYLISPVADDNGEFYDSRKCDDSMPKNADANGAYNIARKGLWVIEQIKQSDDLSKLKLAISNKEWLQFVQGKEYAKQ